MLTTINIQGKKTLLNWLLPTVLFISIFSFSGYAGQSPTRQKTVTQTELFVTAASKTHRKTVCYNQALVSLFNQSFVGSFDRLSVLHFNRISAIHYTQYSKQYFIICTAGIHHHHKIIPQSRKEDDLHIHLG